MSICPSGCHKLEQRGDPAAPLISSLALAALALAVQSICPEVKQTLFVDDRTLTAASRAEVEEGIEIWLQLAQEFGLKESLNKVQLCDPVDLAGWAWHNISAKNHMVVLGSVVGGQPTEQHAKESARWEKDFRRCGRFLPRTYLSRLADMRQFALPAVLFGRIRDLPSQKQVTKRDRHMWHSMGRMAASAPESRSFVAGSPSGPKGAPPQHIARNLHPQRSPNMIPIWRCPAATVAPIDLDK